jgi:hypothetical protein
MREAGFQAVACGIDGPEAQAIALEWSARWDDHRKGRRRDDSRAAPPRSLAEAYHRFKRTAQWMKKATSTRDEWERAWSRIGPVFGEMRPTDVTMELIDAWKSALEEIETPDTVWRCLKIWRALWRIAAANG